MLDLGAQGAETALRRQQVGLSCRQLCTSLLLLLNQLVQSLARLRAGGRQRAVARDFTIGGGDNNKTITMKLGRYYPSGIAMDGRDMVLTADTIDLRGKVVRISATTAISVNGGAVDIGGSSVNVKGSKDSVMKGSKVLGN